MLKPIQEKKLTHFYNILDYNKNGILQQDDFTGIGENICLNLSIQPSNKEYDYLINKSEGLYKQLINDLGRSYGDAINMYDWLAYFDKEVITAKNASLLRDYVQITVQYVFDLYDQNNDGLLSIEEYADMFTIYGIDITYSAKSFTRLDRNHDDGISKAELSNAVKEFFISENPKEGGNWIFGNWET